MSPAIIPSRYPDDWDAIAKRIKDAAGWKCVRCGHRHETPTTFYACGESCNPAFHIEAPRENVIRIALEERFKRDLKNEIPIELARPWPGQRQRVLTVHHLDNDKSNCEDWNLAALCQVCHLHIQSILDVFEIDELGFAGLAQAAGSWLGPYIEGRYNSLNNIPTKTKES